MSQLHRYYQGAMTSCRPSRRTSFPSLGGTTVALVLSLPGAPNAQVTGRELVTPGYPYAGIVPRRPTGSPKFLGNPNCPFAHVPPTPAGLLTTRHYVAAAWPPVQGTLKAPTRGLSTLNSMAFGLAVYASQAGLPQHHARLASRCWSGSPGRAQSTGSLRKVSVFQLITSSSRRLLGAIPVSDCPGRPGGMGVCGGKACCARRSARSRRQASP